MPCAKSAPKYESRKNGASNSTANSIVSTEPLPGIQTGGCGFCNGLGHGLTYLNLLKRPLWAKTSSDVHARMTRSKPSRCISRIVAGFTP